MPENSKSLGLSEKAGAALVPRYGTRHVKQFLVSDTELENLSFINGVANSCFGIGAFLLPWPIQIFLDLLISEKQHPNAEILQKFVALPLLFVAIAFIVGGIIALRKRTAIISIIKDETAH